MIVKKAQFEETLMSQRMCLLYLKMQKMFFKFVPSLDLPINFWWCTAVDCGLTVWVHLSHDRYLECDRVGIYKRSRSYCACNDRIRYRAITEA